MQRWVVREGGPLAGRTVGDIMRQFAVSVVVRRPPEGELALFPAPDVMLQEGDGVVVQGAFDTIIELKREVMPLIESPPVHT